MDAGKHTDKSSSKSPYWVTCCSMLIGCASHCINSQPSAAGQLEDKVSVVEEEFCLRGFDGVIDTISDYAELCVELGYNTLFVAVLPALPLLTLASNLMQLRLDLWKQFFIFRRPIPSGAEDIGAWYGIMQIMATFSVLSNAGLLVFNVGMLEGYGVEVQLVLLIVFVGTIFAIKTLIQINYGDVPKEVEVQLARQTFLVEKLIKRVEDEVNEEIPSLDEANKDFQIHKEDAD